MQIKSTIHSLASIYATPAVEARFWRYVQKQDLGCWEWQGMKNRYGYGDLYVKYPKHILAHRYSYLLLRGDIPEGYELDHLCRNRACVNPDHLEAVTHLVNTRRGEGGTNFTQMAKSRKFCVHGHPYDDINTYIRPDGTGRGCKTCRKISHGKGVI